MVIQHNIPALNAHRNMGLNNSGINKNLEKLSSGFRINRAADDAAGLAISEKMRGQIKGLAMAEQNTSHGINLIQTAEGGLNETHSILQRMRELAVQASNGTYQEDDLQQLTLEFEALKSEIDRIAESTHYNGIKLLNGRLDDTLYAQRMQDANDILKNATFGVNASAGDEFLIAVSATAVTAASSQPVPTNATHKIDFNGALDFSAHAATDELKVTIGTDVVSVGITNNMTASDLVNDIVTALTAIGNTGYTATNNNGELVITSTVDGSDTTFTGAVPTLAIHNGSGGAGGTIFTGGTAPTITTKDGTAVDLTSSFDLTFATLSATTALDFTFNGKTYQTATLTGVNATDVAKAIYDVLVADIATLNAAGIDIDQTAFTAGTSTSISFKAVDVGTNATFDALTISDLGQGGTQLGANVQPTKGSIVEGITLRTQNVPASIDLTQVTVDNQAVKNAVHDIKTNTVRFEDADGNQFTLDYNRLKAGEAMTAQVRAAEGDNLVFQIGANGGSDQRVYLAVTDMSSFTLGLYEGDIKSNGIEATAAEELLLSRANITTIADANIAIDVITAATNQVSSQRAELGALQNRLESAMNSLGITKENLTAAESTIRDVDMAKEMMDFTKNSILVQASQAMLAQANQLPQGVLQLLR